MKKAWIGAVVACAGTAFGQEMIVVGDDVGMTGPAGDDVVAALFWNDFFSAGIAALDSEDDAEVVWIVEDFTIDQAVELTEFNSTGWITSGNLGAVTDVQVRIYEGVAYDGGTLVGESIPMEGFMQPGQGWAIYVTFFDGVVIGPGEYSIVYNCVRPNANAGVPIFFAAPGEHDVAIGIPDNAVRWNPGGAMGWPDNIAKVPADLKGNDCIGVNFTLKGVEATCPADFNGDGVLNVLDFVAFQLSWQAQDPGADCDANGAFDVLDFVCFQQAFVAGCG